MADPSSSRLGGFQVVVAVLIACVTLLNAIVAWRASLASQSASNADTAGLAATINLQEARAVNSILAYQHDRAYTEYVRFNLLGDLLGDSAQTASQGEADVLLRQSQEAYTLAQVVVDSFLPARYIRPDGTYDLQRQISEAMAEAAQAKELEPEGHFKEGDRLRTKSINLFGSLLLFAAAIWLFTAAEGVKSALRYLLAAGGILLMAVGLIIFIVFEIMGILI